MSLPVSKLEVWGNLGTNQILRPFRVIHFFESDTLWGVYDCAKEVLRLWPPPRPEGEPRDESTTYPVGSPEDLVNAGYLVDQRQREAERVDRRRPLRLGHVGRVLERVGVVHELHAARQRHVVDRAGVGFVGIHQADMAVDRPQSGNRRRARSPSNRSAVTPKKRTVKRRKQVGRR